MLYTEINGGKHVFHLIWGVIKIYIFFSICEVWLYSRLYYIWKIIYFFTEKQIDQVMLRSSGGEKKILPVRNQYGFYHSMAFIKYNTIQPVSWKECFTLVKSISGYLSDTLVHFPTGSGWTPKRQWSQIKKQRRPPEGSLFVEWNDSKQRGLRLFS